MAFRPRHAAPRRFATAPPAVPPDRFPPNTRSGRLLAKIAAMALGVLAGCSHAPAQPAPRVAEPSPTVRYDVIVDPNAPRPEISTDQEVQRPAPQFENALPTYPAELVARNPEPYVVAVRLLIDGTGAVVGVSPSPLATGTEGPHAETFRRAVDETVRRWRFTPGGIRTFAPGPDFDGDGQADYKVLSDMSARSFYVDVQFTFAMKDGAGTVSVE